MTKPTLETLAQQVHSLTQCVTGLSQRVAENQRLFEENMRLKDVVIDLEHRLRNNNQQAADLAALRNALEKKFSVSANTQCMNFNPFMAMASMAPMASPVTKSGGNKSDNATSDSKAEASDNAEKEDTAAESDSNTKTEGEDKKEPEAAEEAEEEGPAMPDVTPDPTIKKTKALELDRKTEIPSSMWDQGLVCGITRLSLQYCKLAEIPEKVFTLRCTLKELELGQNLLKEIPADIGKMTKLTKLALNNNQIKELPKELGKLTALDELNLGHNKLTEVPEVVGNLKSLGSLVLGNNQISKTDAAKLLVPLTSLTFLNLENNNISRLEPQLGLIPKLKTLMVSGNAFKIPRPDVVAKGSAEIIAFLKGRCPA